MQCERSPNAISVMSQHVMDAVCDSQLMTSERFFLNYNIVFHLFTHSNWLFIRVVFFCNPNMTPVCSVVLIKETNMPQHINFIITHIFCPILLYVSTTKLNLLLDFFTPAYS